MENNYFESKGCKGSYKLGADNVLHINLQVFGSDEDTIRYIASAPPTRGASFTGSGLPFATQQQAFDNTPNNGVVALDSGKRATLKLQLPNSFYSALGTLLIPPTLFVIYKQQGKEHTDAIRLTDAIPFRSLTYPGKRINATFYNKLSELPVRSQEQILRDSGYPETLSEPDNFWGIRPSV